jgi:hypothetical protein
MRLLRFNLCCASDFVSWMKHTLFGTVSIRRKFIHNFWLRDVTEQVSFGFFYFRAILTKIFTVRSEL